MGGKILGEGAIKGDFLSKVLVKIKSFDPQCCFKMVNWKNN